MKQSQLIIFLCWEQLIFFLIGTDRCRNYIVRQPIVRCNLPISNVSLCMLCSTLCLWYSWFRLWKFHKRIPGKSSKAWRAADECFISRPDWHSSVTGLDMMRANSCFTFHCRCIQKNKLANNLLPPPTDFQATSRVQNSWHDAAWLWTCSCVTYMYVLHSVEM